MKGRICSVGSALVVLAASVSLFAHHSPSAIFEMSKRFTWSGVLTKVDWINPHITVLMDVKTEDGKVEKWTFETNPPLWFKKVGVNRNDFAKFIGQNVSVEGVRPKDSASLYGYLYKITFPGGNSLELADGENPR